MSASESAWGVLRVLAANVMVAMRTITVERGYDPREFTLLAFGGMGPAVAPLIAMELGIRRILIPRDPGTFSAFGMLVTDVQQERSLTRITDLERTSPLEIEALFAELERRALQELVTEKFPPESLVSRRQAGMRYRGQSYEVEVAVPDAVTEANIGELARRFHAAHQRRYGHMAQAEAVEIVNYQATAIARLAKPQLQKFAVRPGKPANPQETRSVYFSSTQSCDTSVWRRENLLPGTRIEGPAVIEEKTSTIVLHPGHRAEVDAYLNIEIEVPG
jgi:N-methylhydantoinase A